MNTGECCRLRAGTCCRSSARTCARWGANLSRGVCAVCWHNTTLPHACVSVESAHDCVSRHHCAKTDKPYHHTHNHMFKPPVPVSRKYRDTLVTPVGVAEPPVTPVGVAQPRCRHQLRHSDLGHVICSCWSTSSAPQRHFQHRVGQAGRQGRQCRQSRECGWLRKSHATSMPRSCWHLHGGKIAAPVRM